MILSDTRNNKGTKFYKEVVRLLGDWPRISSASLIKDEYGFKAHAVGLNGYSYTLWFTNVTKYTANAHLTFERVSGDNSYSYSESEINPVSMTEQYAADQILMFLPC